MNSDNSKKNEQDSSTSIERGDVSSSGVGFPAANDPEHGAQPVEQPIGPRRNRKLKIRLGIGAVGMVLIVAGWLLLSGPLGILGAAVSHINSRKNLVDGDFLLGRELLLERPQRMHLHLIVF